jgi:4-hydroxy-2-oxoglutarate aldolase
MKRKIIPPISTPVVDEQVSPEKLRFNIEKMNSTKVGGYLVLGSNGESVLLTENEKLTVIETAREYTAADKVLVAGTAEESTKKTIALTKRAAELGADYALIGNPNYFKAAMTTANLYDHYVAVAEASTIPVIPYNSPGFTGINMGPDLIGKLSDHSNICGVKDGTGNMAQLAEFRRLGGEDFLIFTGNAPTFLAALFVGVSGGMMPISNIHPDLWVGMMESYYKGDVEEAKRMEALLLPMTKAIMKYGPGGIKAAMDILGYYGGPPLMPLKAPSPEGINEIRSALDKVEHLVVR